MNTSKRLLQIFPCWHVIPGALVTVMWLEDFLNLQSASFAMNKAAETRESLDTDSWLRTVLIAVLRWGKLCLSSS